jgi:hypothetical protein
MEDVMGLSLLTPESLRACLNYDPLTGEWIWVRSSSAKIRPGTRAGNVGGNGRRSITLTVNGKEERHLAHRLAWFWLHDEWPNGNVAPVNGDHLDCSERNLKLESPAQTASKGGARSRRGGASGGIKGVSFDNTRQKWLAYIDRDYKRKVLGRFDTKEQAQAARAAAELETPPSSSLLPDELSIAAAERARDQRAWKRVITEYGVTKWNNAAHFHAVVGFAPSERSRVAPACEEEWIGPDNWCWTDKPMSTREIGKANFLRQNRIEFPDRYRTYALKKNFGIDLPTYQQMFLDQKGLCAVCNQPERDTRAGGQKWLAVDHHHETGAMRGLLCAACNTGLGKFGDDPAILRAAAEYIERFAASIENKIIPITGRGKRIPSG